MDVESIRITLKIFNFTTTHGIMGYSRKKKQIKGGGGPGERGVEDIAF